MFPRHSRIKQVSTGRTGTVRYSYGTDAYRIAFDDHPKPETIEADDIEKLVEERPGYITGTEASRMIDFLRGRAGDDEIK